jgi:hypothetical protein
VRCTSPQGKKSPQNTHVRTRKCRPIHWQGKKCTVGETGLYLTTNELYFFKNYSGWCKRVEYSHQMKMRMKEGVYIWWPTGDMNLKLRFHEQFLHKHFKNNFCIMILLMTFEFNKTGTHKAQYIIKGISCLWRLYGCPRRTWKEDHKIINSVNMTFEFNKPGTHQMKRHTTRRKAERPKECSQRIECSRRLPTRDIPYSF